MMISSELPKLQQHSWQCVNMKEVLVCILTIDDSR